jgi:regulator of protease activity HflC (stomatin/prohibitin superfamily)
MAWFFLLFVALIGVGAARIFLPKGQLRTAVTIGIAAFSVLGTAVVSVTPIAAGEVGVVYRFGEITGQRGEGIAVIFPWERIERANIRTQRATFGQVTAASAETQDVFLEITVNYSLSANAVQALFREVGTNWFEVLVPPRVSNYAKAETAKYSTVDIIPNREVIRRAVRDRLAADLEPYSITVSDLLIDNIDFQTAFKTAIEEKQVATENAKREQERVAQERALADQARARAQGEADASVIRAEGEAAGTVIRAQGTAEANQLIAESLTEAILKYQAIERLGDRVTIALIPSGEGFILDPSALLTPER